MKKAVLAAAFILLMASMAAAQSLKVVRITSERANIRQMASTDSPIVVTVKKDTLLPYLGKNGNWLRVETPDGRTSGYVHNSIAEVIDAPPGTVVKKPDETRQAETSPPKKERTVSSKPVKVPRPSRVRGGKTEKKFYISGMYSMSTQEETKVVGLSSAIYFEDALFNSSYQMDKGQGFGAALGYRFASSLAFELGADISSRNMTITSTFAIPHPLWVGISRGGEVSHNGTIRENSFFANLVYVFSFRPLSVHISAGPCLVMAETDIIEDFQYSEGAYPFSTVTVNQTILREKQNVFGFNAGIGISYQFGDSFALIANVRYISAKMSLSGEGQDLTYPAEITLGGLKAGGGLQFSF